VACTRELSQPLLQLGHLRAHDVAAVIEHALHPGVDLLAQGGVLRLEVDELERRGLAHAAVSMT
jgi:hypothetical protein